MYSYLSERDLKVHAQCCDRNPSSVKKEERRRDTNTYKFIFQHKISVLKKETAEAKKSLKVHRRVCRKVSSWSVR